MKKEIFIEKFMDDDDEMHVMREMHHGRGAGVMREGRGSGHSDRGRGFHIHGGRRDGVGPHQEEGCYTGEKRIHKIRRSRPNYTTKTKMFASKEELIKYVNEAGELGNKIDIYKIEDNLYKVVVVEKYQEEKKETE
jgi:hypothetical protein